MHILPIMGKMVFVNKSNEEAYNRLINSSDPAEYIDLSLTLPLSAYEKSLAAREWMKKTAYTLKDIQYARNRHPYWKKRKCAGAGVRSRRRNAEYCKNTKNRLSNKEVIDFVEMNKKDEEGRYLRKDFELARHFRLSIYGVQHLRRKLNKIQRIFQLMKVKPEKRIIFEYMAYSEKRLHALYLKEIGIQTKDDKDKTKSKEKEIHTWDQLWKI